MNLTCIFRFVHILLPAGARQGGVRVRWWQPTHDGKEDGDWLLDNVRIGGNSVNSNSLSDQFTGPLNLYDWLMGDNIEVTEYCNASHVAKGTTLTNEDSVLTSRDIDVGNDYMLQVKYLL